ncbi:carboxymuconolactone decarboxylase family protein [Oceanospirillum sediminis]|uniref:Carboxymuconolactone decarboxylase family protein n=1 Tax=Oceanospirillum sediminis TaxID=2760088 RepID=A0A839IU49_9GAMM|nr:carboxymuconolactone decarboxylase family protein [Oceanospirillum sediminis]MBB1488973.1 carboxymuconolactone decarboxylase family protein [Oceanospirillum sediminis]
MAFNLHTPETAPNASKDQLIQSEKSFGWIPNLHAVLAEAPVVLEAYKSLHTLFQRSSFNNDELTVVWQVINYENQCHYCLPAHTAIAHMMKVDQSIIDALHTGQPLSDNKLDALRNTTLALVRNRGKLSQEEVQAFHDAGYGNQQLLEILLGIAQKTISNYTNHLANTPVDEAFAEYQS